MNPGVSFSRGVGGQDAAVGLESDKLWLHNGPMKNIWLNGIGLILLVTHGLSSALSFANEDAQQYANLSDKLFKQAKVFLKEPAEFYPRGDIAFYTLMDGAKVTLYRYEPRSGRKIRYKFSVGDASEVSFRGNKDIVVAMQWTGSKAIYRVYDANEPEKLIRTLEVDGPSDGQHGWAYAVDGSDVYLFYTGAVWKIKKWSPRTDTEAKEFVNVTEAGVTDPGEFRDFDVEGAVFVFVESGRIWKLDAKTKKATWLKNKYEAKSWIDFDASSALYGTQLPSGPGLAYFSYAKGEAVNVSHEIRASKYRINATYPQSHYYKKRAARWRDWIIYAANDGIFAFNPTSKAIRPLLLDWFKKDVVNPDDPDHVRDVSISFSEPAVLSDGTTFVYGLDGTHGQVYQIDLKALL